MEYRFENILEKSYYLKVTTAHYSHNFTHQLHVAMVLLGLPPSKLLIVLKSFKKLIQIFNHILEDIGCNEKRHMLKGDTWVEYQNPG